MSFYTNSSQTPSSFAKPILTEPGVKYFLNETLKQCHVFKEKHNNTLFNIGITIIFSYFRHPFTV
jgi:hypothetical protein